MVVPTGKIFIVCSSYKPNIAPTNRLISFLRGLDELEVETQVSFIYPNETRDKMDVAGLSHIHVDYLWKDGDRSNKLMKYLLSFIAAKRYARHLEKGANVLLFGGSEYAPFFTRRKDINVYQERTEHYRVVKMRPVLLQHRYLKAIPHFKGMFVISTALREAYLEAGAKNVVIVNMTVDANRFKGLKKSVGVEPYIAYCGTASNNKDGVDDLIKAFAIVHKVFPCIKLYIIGRAPGKQDASGNRELVSSLGLDEYVIFKGVIPANEMPQMLKNAAIVALARPDSLQAKCGFPTKLGEYLLSQNPVVVTKVGDIPLFLEDGKTALLAEQKNPEDFASRIIWALHNPELAAAIGLEGSKVALRKFNYLTEVKKIVATILAN